MEPQLQEALADLFSALAKLTNCVSEILRKQELGDEDPPRPQPRRGRRMS